MKGILDDVLSWLGDGKRVALASVIAVEQSAPLGPGASLAVCEDGDVVGSVSGGCVEPAVYAEAAESLRTNTSKCVSYGISDDQAFEVGLTCGGMIHLLITPLGKTEATLLSRARAAIQERVPVAVALEASGPAAGQMVLLMEQQRFGSFGDDGLDAAIEVDAVGMLELGETGLRTYGGSGERRREDVQIFFHSFSPPPDMFIFGAIDFAAAVSRVGKFLGYRVTVCDARAVFATPERFPDADEVVVQWPHEFVEGARVESRTVMCILTHDPKFDAPLIEAALNTPAAYIGAMGSRRTDRERRERLRAAGVPESDLARVAGPIGLDIGATTTEEVAVSIAAEIIATRTGASGGRLSESDRPIHNRQIGGDAERQAPRSSAR